MTVTRTKEDIRTEPAPGDGPRRLGKYELLRRVAVGGMAELFLARATGIEGFEKLVVLKRILPQHAGDGRFIRMFLQEARLAATLVHPNVIQVYDIGKVGGTYFFTMEYVHGVDARRLLQIAHDRGQRLPLEHALGIVLGTAAGLHYAHEKVSTDGRPLGIVHRDVSSSNVLVSYDGCPKLVDFGIAKANQTRSETQPGTTKGKIQYMSPEQCQGEAVDRRSDVFSLGVLLYELTTGSRPFDGDNDAVVLRSLLSGTVMRPSERCSDYPPDLEAIVLRALAIAPGDRYATAEALQLALEGFVRERRLVVSPVALSRYLSEVADNELLAWQAAQRSGISLVDFIARTASDGPSLNLELDDEARQTASVTAPVVSTSRSGPVVSDKARRAVPSLARPAAWILSGAAVLALAVIGARVRVRSDASTDVVVRAAPKAQDHASLAARTTQMSRADPLHRRPARHRSARRSIRAPPRRSAAGEPPVRKKRHRARRDCLCDESRRRTEAAHAAPDGGAKDG
jgi:serine/threonine protein kinase